MGHFFSRSFFIFFLFLFNAVLFNTAFAESSAPCARLAVVIGNVRDNKNTLLTEGAALSQGFLVKTGAQSLAKIILQDDSIIDLGPETQSRITQCKIETTNGHIDLAIEVGKIRVNVTKTPTSPRREFKIHTPTSVLAVRGTEFFVVWKKNSDQEIFENIAVSEGTIEIRSQFQKDRSLLRLTSGNEFKVINNGLPQIDQFTASEQRALENQTKIDYQIFEPSVNLDGPSQTNKNYQASKFQTLDKLLGLEKDLQLSLSPLNLFQGAISQAQQGNLFVLAILSGGGAGSSGGSLGSSGLGNPIFGGGRIRVYDP